MRWSKQKRGGHPCGWPPLLRAYAALKTMPGRSDPSVHDLAEGSGEVLHKLSLCIIAGVDFGDGAQMHACYSASDWLIYRAV